MKNPSFLAVFGVLFAVSPAFAWFPQGHSMIAENALAILPDEVPAWFRGGKKLVAHTAQDPDVQKHKSLPMMTEAEFPRHFFDLELLRDEPIPPTRTEFAALCAKLNIKPAEVGELPYSIAEWTQRLTISFAEARRFPKNREIRTKTLVYAGILSHYSADAAMPLHTTIHYDGRVGADGKSPRSGIHARVDALIERVKPRFLRAEKLEPRGDVWAQTLAQIREAHAQIDATYALENSFPLVESKAEKPDSAAWKASPALEEFTRNRAQNAQRFTANLFLTAWRDSAKIELPTWLKR